jgi:hypothetical protein
LGLASAALAAAFGAVFTEDGGGADAAWEAPWG